MEGWIERCILFGEVVNGGNGLSRTILGEEPSTDGLLLESGYGERVDAKEQNDIDTLNELFRLHRMGDEVVRNAANSLEDMNGKDGEFSRGPKSGQAFEMKHQPQPKGMEDIIKVNLAFEYKGNPPKGSLRYEGATWVNGWLNAALPQYLIWYVQPRHFYIVPFSSLRSKLSEVLGIDASELRGPHPNAIKYVLDYSNGVVGYPGSVGYPFRERYEDRWNVNVAIDRRAIPGLIDIRPPTAEEEAEYGRQEAEAKRRAEEENARRAREAEERRKTEQTAAKTEIDKFKAAGTLVCPFDDAPLKWNPKKKFIRCTKGSEINQATGRPVGGQQLCGLKTAHGAGRGGVQGSDLNKIKSKYISNRDYQSANVMATAIDAYKKLVFTLDREVIPTEREVLRGNLARVGIILNTPEALNGRMRNELRANGLDPNEWDLLIASGRFKDVPPAEVRDARRRLERDGYKV